ncbi:MAG TPA: hypothetical protein VH684_06235 [Xanthobacteraceae bacterium]|jgi:hypothetical protein
MLRASARGAFTAIVTSLAAALTLTAAAADGAKYPDWKGQWNRQPPPRRLPGQVSFDPNKGWAQYQQAPLTPEYQKVLEANIKSQEQGGSFDWRGSTCRGFGMPIITYAVQPMELIITPETTYALIDWVEHTRRIYTDGRDWPKEIEPTLVGYSIGKWFDTDGDGRFDTLEVESRGFKGPRHYDAGGLPLHHDNQSIFRERISLDRTNPNLMHDEITVIDHALTRPWTVTRTYVRNTDPRPDWGEFICAEGSDFVVIGGENYFLSADGLLMPTRNGQRPPDERYFKNVKE